MPCCCVEQRGNESEVSFAQACHTHTPCACTAIPTACCIVSPHHLMHMSCRCALHTLVPSAPQALPNLRTSTFVMRQAAASVGVASPFATAAGPPSSAGSSPTASFRPNNSISGSGAGSIPGQRLLMRPSRLASHRLPGSGALSIGLSGSGVQRIGSALAPAAESDLEEPEPEFKLPT